MTMPFPGQAASVTGGDPTARTLTATSKQASPRTPKDGAGRLDDRCAKGIAPPPCTKTLEDTGLNAVMLAELTLKFLAVRGNGAGHELAQDVCLPFPILEP